MKLLAFCFTAKMIEIKYSKSYDWFCKSTFTHYWKRSHNFIALKKYIPSSLFYPDFSIYGFFVWICIPLLSDRIWAAYSLRTSRIQENVELHAKAFLLALVQDNFKWTLCKKKKKKTKTPTSTKNPKPHNKPHYLNTKTFQILVQSFVNLQTVVSPFQVSFTDRASFSGYFAMYFTTAAL